MSIFTVNTDRLAATKGIRITRREFLKVNIGKTCEDIMDYVLVRVPPLHPSLPRPRFSLYLSSQLQYGVVIVYHRQCAFLLEEVQNTIERLLRAEMHSQIDIQEMDRLALDIPDPLFLMEEAGGAIEPFFGVMRIECELPRPCQLPQSWQFKETSSPEIACRPVTSKQNTVPIGLTVSPETITIKDKEPPSILTAEFGGAELPEVTALQIELLMQQEDPFLLTGEVEHDERERVGEGQRWREGKAAMVPTEQLLLFCAHFGLKCYSLRGRAGTGDGQELHQTVMEVVMTDYDGHVDLTQTVMEVVMTDSVMAVLKETVDRSWIIEDTGRPVEVFKQMVAMEKTPPPLTVPAISEPSEKDLEQNQDTECSSSEILIPDGVALPENRRHHCLRKRQLIFADQHMQISQHAMREQISNPLTETHALSDVLLKVPPTFRFSSTDLLSSPCNSLFHPDLRSLWKQCCLLPLKKRQRLQERSEPSEMERERSVEEDRQQRRSESSREAVRLQPTVSLLGETLCSWYRFSGRFFVLLLLQVLRESSEAGLLLPEVSAASDVVLDESKGDSSQNDLITPVSRRSPMEEGAGDIGRGSMEMILEECVELNTAPEKGEITPHTLLRMLNTYLQRYGEVSFHSLLPPEADRGIVAHVFYKVL
ncbi:hypothetical protein P4O66_010580, partial [Electrophorus voltai]